MKNRLISVAAFCVAAALTVAVVAVVPAARALRLWSA